VSATTDRIVPDMLSSLNAPNTRSRKRKVEEGGIGSEPVSPNGEDNNAEGDNAQDPKKMKKQKRLVKNREAAQLFRQRQKEYISNLEAKAAELTSANAVVNARLELLAAENKIMKEQLLYLRTFMKQAISLSFPQPIKQEPNPLAHQQEIFPFGENVTANNPSPAIPLLTPQNMSSFNLMPNNIANFNLMAGNNPPSGLILESLPTPQNLPQNHNNNNNGGLVDFTTPAQILPSKGLYELD